MGILKKHSPFSMYLQWLSLLPLALGSAVLPRESEVNYDGHQVYRVHTGGDDKHVFDKLAGLQYEEWGHRKADFIDVSVKTFARRRAGKSIRARKAKRTISRQTTG